MKISRKRYVELGLEICEADCEHCCICYEKDGKLHCEEMADNISIKDAIELGMECPELDYDRIKDEMTDEEYDAWRHNRLDIDESLTIGEYERIEKVKYNDGTYVHLLTGVGAGSGGFEVELEGNCFFNTEFEVEERTLVLIVNTIQDVLDFAKTLNIDLTPNYNGKYLLVGGEKDMCVFDNLEYNWLENLEV